MVSNSFADFIGYFRQLAAEHVELKHFAHGPAARILASTRTGFAYPCLWLETPSLQLNAQVGGDPNGVRQCAFVVLTQNKGNYDAQDAAWALTEQLALDVLARMRHDKKKRLFDFEETVRMDAISSLQMDNDIGWRVEFETGKSTGLCYEAAKWVETPPAPGV